MPNGSVVKDYSPSSSTQIATYKNARTLTESNDAFTEPVLEFYVGGAGDVAVETAGGDTITLTSVAAGTTFRLQITKLLPASTASNIVGFW